jgi:hypothetical protein
VYRYYRNVAVQKDSALTGLLNIDTIQVCNNFLLFNFFIYCNAQSVYCLTTDWTTGTQSLEEGNDLSSSLCIHTSSEAHPVSHRMGTGGPFP